MPPSGARACSMARPLLLRFHLGVDACWFAAADPLCSPLPAPCTLQAAALPPLPACSEQRHPGAPAPLQRHHLPPLPPPLPAPHRQHRPHPGAPLLLLLVLVLLAGCGRCLQDGGPVHSGICAGNTACLFVCPPPAALPPVPAGGAAHHAATARQARPVPQRPGAEGCAGAPPAAAVAAAAQLPAVMNPAAASVVLPLVLSPLWLICCCCPPCPLFCHRPCLQAWPYS